MEWRSISIKKIVIMKKLVLICSVVLVAILGCKEEQSLENKVVSPEEMQVLLQLDNVQLVDVRTPEEYKEGFIANAQNIDFYSATFNQDILKLDKEKPVILYCKSGRRSANCAKKMKDAGFKKVYDLEGGISKWKHEGLEVKQ